MIQKPSLKNGQKIIHDAIPKTSTAEPQQQQQQRKGERSSHVPDVVKTGNGVYQHPAKNGVANALVENERFNLSNGSTGLVNASQNGTHERHPGSGRPTSAKPVQNGNSSSGRPLSYNGPTSSAAGKSGGRPSFHGPGGSSANFGDGKLPLTRTAVQSAAGGSRGRDASVSAGSHSNVSAAPADNGAEAAIGRTDGAGGGRPRDMRRRGGRSRVGLAESSAAGADTTANGINTAGNGLGGGVPERQLERIARPRGDRPPRGTAQEAMDANGSTASVPPGPAVAIRVAASGEREDAERGGHRGGRGRRSRGGQYTSAPEGGEVGTEAHRPAGSSVPAVDGMGQQQERKARQSRQRLPREPRPPPQNGADEGVAMENSHRALLDGQQITDAKQHRRGRDSQAPHTLLLEQPGYGQRQRTLDAEGIERDPQEGGRGGGKGRSGRRRNGHGSDAGGTGAGAVGARTQAGCEGVPGRRQRPPRPPRQQQQQTQQEQQQQNQEPPLAVDHPHGMPAQEAVEETPAPPASHVHFPAQNMELLPPAVFQSAVPLVDASALGPLPPPQPQANMAEQQLYPPPPFQDGQPLLDFSQQQQLLHHMLPHQYPQLPEYQQPHFMQQHHHHQQFDPAYQQFQQHLLQQHLGPPPPGAHGYMPGPFSTQGDPMGGPPPMPPAFFPPGANAYGQMLVPLPTFGSVPVPSAVPQHGLAPPSPPQQFPPQDMLAGYHEPQTISQLSDTQCFTVESEAHFQEHWQEEQRFTLEESKSEVAPTAVLQSEGPVMAVPVEPEKPTNAPSPPNIIPEAPASEPVKNEWADRLAQQALARMNAVKSSLINGTVGRSDGVGPHGPGSANTDERTRNNSLVRPAAYTNDSANGSSTYNTSLQGSGTSNGNGNHAIDTEAWRSYGDQDATTRRNIGSSNIPVESWRNGLPINGAPVNEMGNGWRANLAPTGVADAAEVWRMRGRSGDVGENQTAPASYVPPRREESPPPGANGMGAGRPKLNLNPRSKPLPPPQVNTSTVGSGADGPGAAIGAASNGTRSSIFGAARPREEVLRERGVAEPERLTIGNVAYANGIGSGIVAGGPGRFGAPAGSATSGVSDDDQWLTVGKGGRSKPPPTSSDVGNVLLDAASDPFFTGRTAGGTGVAIVGRYGVGSYGKGSYGSHGAGGDTYMNAYGASRGYGNSYGNDDDEPIFKRGLPTRHDGPF